MEEENNRKGQLALTVGSKRAFCGFRGRNFVKVRVFAYVWPVLQTR